MRKKTMMLLILDGWGYNPNSNEKNAITEANPKNFLNLFNNYPHTLLKASGEAVGLPDGQMGNSEVGHLNLGAGRVVYQPLVEILKDIRNGSFFKKDKIVEAFDYAKEKNKSIHFMGLLSDGGVHSHISHLFALLDMAKKMNLTKVYIHMFMDGRDTAPTSGKTFIEELNNKIKELGVGKIASISGRYFAMDRDNNWDRIKMAYDTMVGNVCVSPLSLDKFIDDSYAKHITDEFIEPTLLDSNGAISEGDVVINFNFRPDRAREITRAFTDKSFDNFERKYLDLKYYCMRQYDSSIDASVIYTDKDVSNTFGEIVSSHGLSQLRIAETEKYAHVTFFFNGGKEQEFLGEDRILVASPKVKTYDLQPEMSALVLTEKVLTALDSQKYDVIIMNFANADMVGHTGDFTATVQAIKTIDNCIDKISKKILELDGTLFITADHGNAEKMVDPITNVPFTAHTTYEVPFIYVSNNFSGKLTEGKLADVAPTMLEVLNIEKPKEMDGISLIKKQ